MAKQSKTSWEDSARWYDLIVGTEGHYYHENVIFPKLLPLMDLKGGDRVLDLACGQGVLARKLPKEVHYVGLDLSKSLIDAAKKREIEAHRQFLVQDVATPFSLKQRFTHASIILALQNIEDPSSVLTNASHHLEKNGRLFIILNHPCFRIPRQSSWGWDEQKKLQYRRIDSYMSAQKIPIHMHPGKDQKEETLSYHLPLSSYSQLLNNCGFLITEIHEWVSNKTSTGSKAKMENRSRQEFPLFLAIVAQKVSV